MKPILSASAAAQCHAVQPQLGRNAEAAEIVEHRRKTFSALLSVEPSRETTAIYETLLQPS